MDCDAEIFCDGLGQRTRADIDREVTTSCKWVEAKVAERLWEAAARMIADQQDGLFRQGVEHTVRPGLIGSQ